MSEDDITDDQLCREYIEYATENLLFALIAKKKTRTETVTSENRFKEQDPDRIFDRNCLDYRNKLVQIYEEKANAVKIRST